MWSADPSADGRRSSASRTAIGWGRISFRRRGVITCLYSKRAGRCLLKKELHLPAGESGPHLILESTTQTAFRSVQPFWRSSWLCEADRHAHSDHNATSSFLRITDRSSSYVGVCRAVQCDRHATRVVYRLTVQTLPDGLETQFTPPDRLTRHRQHCLVVSGGRCELGIRRQRVPCTG